MKSKLQILYETVYNFIQCWYDGEPEFLNQAMSIQFLPERVAFVLSELVRATNPAIKKDAVVPFRAADAETDAEADAQVVVPFQPRSSTDEHNFIQMAHESIQKLSMMALGHMINADTTNVTVTSLTDTVRTLTITLCAQDTEKEVSGCPVS